MPKNTAAQLAESVDKVVAHLNQQGPQLTADEVRAAHRQLDQAAADGTTADDVRCYRRS
ncbi:hypothetical protein GLX30_30330 [Streptomyces sp. Tu 2975]|uniref:hypothetical protein n=1 Tax=Streptomyces sp. Tu 2975 TaxID=2676871 RepID=UPI00135BEEE9|nr:hypothetical protein [Streptomyces sp. Tu 2975]QIP87612.1 hypothetical protein GLX30_30330 [Streptomyces sp. Tu 2975]